MVVDLHAIDGAAVLAFMIHIDDVVLDVFIELPFLDVEGEFLFPDVEKQCLEFQHGHGVNAVGEDKRHAAEKDGKDKQGTHGGPKRDARCLDGHQLVMLSKVAKTHDRSQ